MTGGPRHRPVLCNSVLNWLVLKAGDTAVDLTGGRAGHSRLMANILGPKGFLIVMDKDPEAVKACRQALAEAPCRVEIVHEDFRNVADVLSSIRAKQVDAILADLGVSADQLLDPMRGFGFDSSGSLDMRMNPASQLTASQILATWPVKKLAEIFAEYGDVPAAGKVAAAIVQARNEIGAKEWDAKRLRSSATSVLRRARGAKIDPATRIFQALRIAVNDELGALKEMLPKAFEALKIGGRLAVISFHSGEDRIVKKFMHQEARGCICPPDFPVCRCGKVSRALVLTSRPIRPDDSEVNQNPRARSAKLRICERIG